LSKVSSLQEFNEDIEWLQKHRDKLIPRYGDKWVAVWKEKIVDHDEDLDALIRRLINKGYEPEHMVIEYLSREPIEAIL